MDEKTLLKLGDIYRQLKQNDYLMTGQIETLQTALAVEEESQRINKAVMGIIAEQIKGTEVGKVFGL